MADTPNPKKRGRPKKPESQKKKRKTLKDLANELAEEMMQKQKERAGQPSLIDQIRQEQKRQPVCDEYIEYDEVDAWEEEQAMRRWMWRWPE